MNQDQNGTSPRCVKPYPHNHSLLTTCGCLLALTGFVWLLTGCGNFRVGNTITGSGRTVTQQPDLAGFSKVSVGSAFHVTISQGSQYGVTVTVDDNLVEYLDVTKSGDTLRIHLKPNVGIRNATLKAQVTMPELAGLDLSGASKATAFGFKSEKPLKIDLSGATHLQGDITSDDAHFGLSGASHLQLHGSANDAKVHASGASKVHLEEYRVRNAHVSASGASHIIVNVSGNLEADASGASSVRYIERPQNVSAHTSGASKVEIK